MSVNPPTQSAFFLFADCFPVKGAKNMSICDTGRKEIYLLPTHCYEVLVDMTQHPLVEAEARHGAQIVTDLVAFSERKEIGFVSSLPRERFPRLDESRHSHRTISNAIVDIRHQLHDFTEIVPALSDMGCVSLQIRAYAPIPLDYLHAALNILHESSITSVEVYVQHHNFSDEETFALLDRHPVIANLVVFGSTGGGEHRAPSTTFNMSNLYHTEQCLTSCDDCGVINMQSMVVGTPTTFFDFKYANSCLYQKIAIDEAGAVRNCPSLPQSYGQLGKTPLREIAQSAEFRYFGNITKDEIDVCKDCEFRYVCSDCRAYTRGGLHGKPAKCNYDPYSGRWTTPNART